MFLYSDFEEFTWVEGSFSDQGDWVNGVTIKEARMYNRTGEHWILEVMKKIILIINENNVSTGAFAHCGKPADCVGVCSGFDLGDKLFSI